MTEQRAEDTRERDRKRRIAARREFADELNCTQLEAFDRLRQVRKDLWEALNKALNTLMVGHAAGLVTCLTLLKDYNAASPGPLRGLGIFILLFGVGLVIAVISVWAWTVGAGVHHVVDSLG